MTQVRSRRFFSTQFVLPLGAAATLYTVPADRTALIHYIVITTNHTAAVLAPQLNVAVRPSGGGDVPLTHNLAITATSPYEVFGPVILNPGDALRLGIASGNAGDLIEAHAFGSLLDGAPV